MRVTTDDEQPCEQDPRDGDGSTRPSYGVEESLAPKAHESDRTAERGWRAVLVTVEVWALAVRRHWPAVRAELAATPGQLASIAAGALEEAATDVAASARTLRELVAWSVWATVWAYRSTGGLLRAHWPGVRRRLVTLARATAVLVARGARRAGRAAWVAVLLTAAATRATASFLARRVPKVLAAVAAVAVATGQRVRRAGSQADRRGSAGPVETAGLGQRSPAIEPFEAVETFEAVRTFETVEKWEDRPAPAPRRLGPRRRLARVVAICTAISALLLLLAGGAIVAARAALATAAGSMHLRSGHVTLPPLAERSIVYAADGSVLAVLHVDDNRQPVTLGQISPVLVDAVIDTEDAHFWKHGGVDPPAMVRALAKDVAAGRARQGGSTIAQQLVKNTLLTPKRNVGRKIKEIVLADRVEHQLGKRAVLERYLNTVYLGNGAYGAEAAAETYFSVPASGLSPAQAGLLAGLIQDPEGYDPVRAPVASRQRRQTVLGLLVSHHHLAPDVARTASQEPLPVSVHRPPEGRDYFSDAVRQELLADRRLGPTPKDRYFALFSGGLRIHTTLDPVLQHQAEAAIAGGLPHTSRHLTAALVAVDPGTGAVRALVGGPDFGQSQFNAALAGAGRQPGSSFKAFTLAAALSDGYSPLDVVDGSTPCTIPNPGGTPDPWVPGNFEGEAFGPITLTDATAHSVNCAYARLAPSVGLRRIADVAHSMGITSRLHLVPSLTLGTNVVTPLQMASAYSTFAADGVAHTAHLVEEVDGPDGKPLLRAEGAGRRAISPQVAREETQVLQQVVLSGTGQAAAVAGHPVAGKTGTAENYQDAWFVGYTPDLTTAVWMGDPDGEVPMRDVEGINVVGGSFPARMWSAFMTQALANRPVLQFQAPDPTQVPAPTFIVMGQPRPGTGPGAPAPGQPYTTTWCWSSCGRPNPPPGTGGPAPSTTTPPTTAPPQDHHKQHG